jgi:hypothetical protein
MDDNPTTVIVVRHGERIDETSQAAEWYSRVTEERESDPELTARGHEQARAAGPMLAQLLLQYPSQPDTVHCSAMQRCLETATSMMMAANINLPIQPVNGLSACAAAVACCGQERYPYLEADAMAAICSPLTTRTSLRKPIGFLSTMSHLAASQAGGVLLTFAHREAIRDLKQLAATNTDVEHHPELKVKMHHTPPYCAIAVFEYSAKNDSWCFKDQLELPAELVQRERRR